MRGAVFKKIMVFAACGLIAAILGLEKAKAASRNMKHNDSQGRACVFKPWGCYKNHL